MNECCGILILFILFLFDEILYIIVDSMILALSIWTTKALKILYCIYFAFTCIRISQCLSLFIMSCLNKCQKIIETMIKIFTILFLISILFWIYQIIILTINFKKFRRKYWKNCPFVISDLEYKLHYRRRCELYNINYNSRYSYQYICSYDSSKDFDNNLKKEIKPDNIICLPFSDNIENNDIVNLFQNEYKKEKKYYCSRTNKPNPKDYSYAKQKDCKDKKYRYMLAFIILAYLRILFIIWPFFSICLVSENFLENRNIFGNFDNISRKSTNVSEISQKIEDIGRQNTSNIIIENKQEYVINSNIKDMEKNNIEKNNSKDKVDIKSETQLTV